MKPGKRARDRARKIEQRGRRGGKTEEARVAIDDMDFAPFHGWLQNGQRRRQGFEGLNVLAHRPEGLSTPVVVLTRAAYDELKGGIPA